MAKAKAVCSPSRKESEMRLGKKRSPVMVLRWAGVSRDNTWGPRRWPAGL